MTNYRNGYVVTMDTNDLFIYLGFCPEKVRLYNADGKQVVWYRMQGSDASFERVVAGDITVNTDKGIKLVQFTDTPVNTSSDPTAIDPGEFYKANGIQLTSDIAFLADNTVCFYEAWGMTGGPVIKCTHDDTTNSNTYCGDASYDFRDIGVTPNNWIVVNATNGDWAYVKEVARPSGSRKYSRLYTATDRDGTATTAADFDTGDVFYVMPITEMWYPMSDVGAMT